MVIKRNLEKIAIIKGQIGQNIERVGKMSVGFRIFWEIAHNCGMNYGRELKAA